MNPKLFFSFLLILTCLFTPSLHAQNPFIKKLERKAKRKLEQRAEQKADRAIDKGLDKLEGAVEKSVKEKASKKEGSASSSSEGASMEAKPGPVETKEGEDSELKKNKEEVPVLRNRRPEGPKPFEQTHFGNESIDSQGTLGKGPYGISSGMFIQVTRTSHDMMEGTMRDTVYFENFGQLQARYQYSRQEVNMMGIKNKEESRLIAIHRNDSIYSLNPEKKKGYVMKNPAQEFYQGMSEQDIQGFGQEMEEGMNTKSQRLGTERVAGKLCEVLEYTSHTETGEIMMITRMWWWRGMNLKTISRGMGTEIHQEMILLKDHISVDKRRFIPDPNINYQSFSLGNY